ncbi:rhodopsin, GQ-coupled-like [Oculina patagonica]
MDFFVSVITGVSITILLCNVVGNVLVIMVIKKNKKLHNANTYLLANLASSDLAFAVLTFVDIFLLSNQSVQSAYSFAEFIFHDLASIFILVALAVKRYFAILKPFVHLTRAVKSLMCKVLLAIWILAGVLSAPGYPITALSKEYAWKSAMMNVTTKTPVWFKAVNMSYSFVLFTFGLILPSAVMIFCYSRVIYHVWFNTEANGATNLALLQSRRKLTKLFIIVTLIFIVTWTPTFGRLIVTQFVKSENSWKFELCSILLAMAGSTANPVIYSFRCPRFRQDVVKLLPIRCCKRNRRPKVTRSFAANSYSLKETKRTQATIEPVSISFGV